MRSGRWFCVWFSAQCSCVYMMKVLFDTWSAVPWCRGGQRALPSMFFVDIDGLALIARTTYSYIICTSSSFSMEGSSLLLAFCRLYPATGTCQSLSFPRSALRSIPSPGDCADCGAPARRRGWPSSSHFYVCPALQCWVSGRILPSLGHRITVLFPAAREVPREEF